MQRTCSKVDVGSEPAPDPAWLRQCSQRLLLGPKWLWKMEKVTTNLQMLERGLTCLPLSGSLFFSRVWLTAFKQTAGHVWKHPQSLQDFLCSEGRNDLVAGQIANPNADVFSTYWFVPFTNLQIWILLSIISKLRPGWSNRWCERLSRKQRVMLRLNGKHITHESFADIWTKLSLFWSVLFLISQPSVSSLPLFITSISTFISSTLNYTMINRYMVP